MEIHPIRTEDDYETALARVEVLFDADAGTSAFDELDVLTTLIEVYETKHHPVGPPTPIEAIKFRMEQGGLRRKDVEGLIGLSRARLSEVLTKRRALSIGMIRKFNKKLSIPTDVLVREYGLSKSPARLTRAAKKKKSPKRKAAGRKTPARKRASRARASVKK